MVHIQNYADRALPAGMSRGNMQKQRAGDSIYSEKDALLLLLNHEKGSHSKD